jgi:hypothetical protein
MAKSFSTVRDTREVDLGDTITFGKWSGSTVDHLLKVAPGYLRWVASNTDYYLSKTLQKELDRLATIAPYTHDYFLDDDIPF